MTKRDFERKLRALMEREPFRPFVVELRNGKRFEVDRPRTVSSREGSAVALTKNGPVIFDNRGVLRISGKR